MATPSLSTKFFVPSLRPTLVVRPRLIEELNTGLERKLILVSAPAGYGKTTLIAHWLHEANISSAWLSLDENDNDLTRFFQYFIDALQRVIPALEDLTDMPPGEQAVPFVTSLNLLIDEISGCIDPSIIVLDDFHVIHSRAVLDTVTFLLEHMPPEVHLVLISRTDPPIPLSRLRVRNELLDIRAEQLRFTADEIAVFLNEIMKLNLSVSDLAMMEARTEGWIASLQLAALSMKGSKDTHAFITAFAGSHHYIMDYLVEEVLNLQTEKIRLFLLQTSILDRMCASLCNAVVDVNDREGVDGQQLLETLEQMNLFLIPLDDERRWYRYHHLFADVLNKRAEHLFPDQRPTLHRRASHWYEQNGWIPQAIHHALAGGDTDFAIQLIEQNGFLLLIRGELSTLPHWIKAVEPHAQNRPWIYMFKAWLSALTGYPEQVEPMLQMAENLISAQESSLEIEIMHGAIATGRAYLTNLQGKTSLAASFARQALEFLPDVDLASRSLRVVATSLLGDACSMNGDLIEAQQAYRAAKQMCESADDIHLVIVANSNLANVIMEQGLLHEAAQIYADTLQLATRPNGQELVIAGRLHIEMSQLSYEWNDIEIATQHVHRCMQLCREWGNIDLQAVAYVMLARLEHIQHHPEKTQKAIRSAERLMQEHHLLPKYSAWISHALGRLWIEEGDPGKAFDCVEKSSITMDDPELQYLHEPEYLVLLRILLLQGDYDASLRLSERLLHQAETAKRASRVIDVLILQALIFQKKKDMDESLSRLGKALSLAKSEHYVRTFLDEGEPMARLLHLAKARRIETEYVTELLSAMGDVIERTQTPKLALVEPLSPREVEVLRLIEAGCSNQEIAGRLVISIATVKRHISNIYAKLSVQNRTQAVLIGKELGLLN